MGRNPSGRFHDASGGQGAAMPGAWRIARESYAAGRGALAAGHGGTP